MKHTVLAAAGGTLLLAATTVAGATSAGAAASGNAMTHRSAHTCAAPKAGSASCTALVRVDKAGKPAASGTPSGYGPADIQAAYQLGGGSGQTVAIVDAYNDPTAEADLGVYRAQFGLPACTTANGCFKKVSQTGSTTSLPQTNAGWATEISLDLDMVSAACPGCHILLVEAKSATNANLATAVNYAASVAGVVAISNSYGGSDTTESSAYNHPGIAITASTGDSGYGIESPASYPHVIAVGGTSLTKSGSSYSEKAWSGAGSGCSTINPKPAWQTSATKCSGKANADVSAVADPNTGVAVYDSTRYQGASGWQVYGGTSASSPIIASAYALGGNHGYSYPAQYTWSQTSSLHDVTSGSNGTCSTTVWCTAGTGWDGPTGLGTPNGVGAF
ncbi:MAG: S53 family peptidase [Jatrophihabitans sp.]|uniref:S53 family peptidase n=1 Tax=Jatrophihabitans sp. TaxID=1932789 RepID=UPI003F7D28E7